ncbi:MAG: hypothetical protein AAGB34_05685 [Planctomycetota bacterium]
MQIHVMACSAVALVCSGVASAEFIRPDSATAVSEFSSQFHIENAIDGTGMPADFGPSDTHEIYNRSNHWTTGSGAIGAGTARATFSFNTPQTVGTFYLWNHRANRPVDNLANSNDDYFVTDFDLILRDAVGAVLLELNNLSAVESEEVLVYGFPQTSGVVSVEFIINANGGASFTGVAEVGFDTESIPAPGSATLLIATGVAATRRRR